jgi:hypothetical protein
LAPLYDTVPTALWPGLRRDLAMAINGRESLDAIRVEDLVDEAEAWHVDTATASTVVLAAIDRILSEVIDGTYPGDFVRLVRQRCATLTAR